MFTFEMIARASQMSSNLRLNAREVLRMDPLEPLIGIGTDLALRIANHRLPAWRIVKDIVSQIPIPQPIIGATR